MLHCGPLAAQLRAVGLEDGFAAWLGGCAGDLLGPARAPLLQLAQERTALAKLECVRAAAKALETTAAGYRSSL